jgi:sialate O-acetylesterase
MIAPAVPYIIRGFLWYQGETDSNPALHNPQLYSRLFPTMIRDWRARWNEGDLPFLYVQISNFNSPHEDWGTIRDAQRRTLSITNTAMAVSLDVGTRDNVHPPDKQTVADRLALAARNLVYGEHVPDSGPLPISITTTDNGLRVWFSHADGLRAQGDTVHGFALSRRHHRRQLCTRPLLCRPTPHPRSLRLGQLHRCQSLQRRRAPRHHLFMAVIRDKTFW